MDENAIKSLNKIAIRAWREHRSIVVATAGAALVSLFALQYRQRSSFHNSTGENSSSLLQALRSFLPVKLLLERLTNVQAEPDKFDTKSRPELDRYEQIIQQDLVSPEMIADDFGSIGGLESEIDRIHELVILPLVRPNLFRNSRLATRPSGLLLYGPPGTGKTLLARAVAHDCGANFLNVNPATLFSKWVGESEKLTQAVFTLARKLSPTIIFIDELDGFLDSRNNANEPSVNAKVKTLFMSLWDGLATQQAEYIQSESDESYSSQIHLKNWVLIIGATNRPWALDQAILRRMPQQIKVDLPNVTARTQILHVLLKHEPNFSESEVDIPRLALLTEGYSGSDLKELCRTAALVPIREAHAAERQQIRAGHERISEEFAKRKYWRKQYGTADNKCHLSINDSRTVAAVDVSEHQLKEWRKCPSHAPAWLLCDETTLSRSERQAITDMKTKILDGAVLRDLKTDDFISSLAHIKATGSSALDYFIESSDTLSFPSHAVNSSEGIIGNSKRLLGAVQTQRQSSA